MGTFRPWVMFDCWLSGTGGLAVAVLPSTCCLAMLGPMSNWSRGNSTMVSSLLLDLLE